MGSIIHMKNHGGKRGRPALPADLRGVQIRHRVLPLTRSSLIEIGALTGEVAGAVLDRLVAKELRRVQRNAMRPSKEARGARRALPKRP